MKPVKEEQITNKYSSRSNYTLFKPQINIFFQLNLHLNWTQALSQLRHLLKLTTGVGEEWYQEEGRPPGSASRCCDRHSFLHAMCTKYL